MQLKVYEITWGETQTATGTVAGNVVSYNITFSDQGVQGPTGSVGLTGPSNVLNIGTVTTGAAGSNASATITGTSPSQTLNLTVPRGNTGATGSQGPVGPANSLTIGAVTTGAAGSSASAAITGAAPNQTLSLTIPQGLPGTGLETLTTQGDTLYRGASTGQRLPIGTAGQILKVSAGGIPEWGAAPASGVSSVSGKTGAVLLDSTDIFTEQALQIADAGIADCNGVFVYGGLFNSRPTYYKTKDTFLYWDGSNWAINHNGDDEYFGTATTHPWQAVWSLGDGANPLPVVTQAASHEFEQVVGQRTNPTTRGDAAGKNVGTGANDVAAGNDARFTDARQPLSHSSAHHTGGADALAAHQINGQTIFTTAAATYGTDQTLSVQRARQITISNSNASGITVTLPTGNDGTLAGDTYVIVGGSTIAGPVTVRGVANLSPLVYSTLATITAAGQQYRFRSNGGSAGSWGLVPVDTHTHTFGTTAGTFAQGNDARLSNARTPTAHAASHAAAGSDPLFDQGLNTTDSPTFASATITTLTGDLWQSSTLNSNITFDDNVLQLNAVSFAFNGNASLAAGDHVHGNLTNDGKVGSTSGLPLVTTTAGAVTTLALGTANQVLRTKSDLSGVEFADPSGGGVTGAAASASDVLGVSGANITGVDAGSDKIVFWDDSASELTYLTVGSGLSLTDTTLTATASGGSKTYAVFTATDNQPPATAFATLDTRNSIAVLDFDDTTDESAVFVGIMPEGASLGSGLKIRLHWMATTATSGNVVWDVSLERTNTDLDSDSFDTIASGTAAANGTSGILTVTEITLTTIDSVTAGDGYRLKVTRDANNASDTMTGDAELVVCEVRSAA